MGLIRHEKNEGKIKEGIIPAWFVKQIKHTSITPNQITWLGFLVSVIGFYFLILGNYWLTLVATGLLFIGIILDTSDGCLARVNKNGSPLGGWYDKLCDHLGFFLLIFAVALGVYLETGSAFIWFWAFISISSIELSTVILYNFRKFFTFSDKAIADSKGRWNFFIFLLFNDFFLLYALAIFAVFDLMLYYLPFIAIYGSLYTIAMTISMERKARKIHKV